MTKTCDNCGNPVSSNFYRVFSANDGILAGCQECATGPWLHRQDPEVIAVIREARQQDEYLELPLGRGEYSVMDGSDLAGLDV